MVIDLEKKKLELDLNLLEGEKFEIDDLLSGSLLVLGSEISKSERIEHLLVNRLRKFPIPLFAATFSSSSLPEIPETRMEEIAPEVASKKFLEDEGKHPLKVVLSQPMKDTEIEWMQRFLQSCFVRKQQGNPMARKPSIFIFEKAENFIPAKIPLHIDATNEWRLMCQIVKLMIIQGRCLGMQVNLFSNQPDLAVLDKNMVAQTRTRFLLKIPEENERPIMLWLYRMLLPVKHSHDIASEIKKFDENTAYFVGGKDWGTKTVQFKKE